MISEKELADLSYPGAPKFDSSEFPGPKSQALLKEAPEYESMTRGAGEFLLVYMWEACCR